MMQKDTIKYGALALFFSLLIITVSFLPVFALEAQEGRLFKPLAWTKTLAMASAALLAITLVPVAMGYFIRGRIRAEGRVGELLRQHGINHYSLRTAAGTVRLSGVDVLVRVGWRTVARAGPAARRRTRASSRPEPCSHMTAVVIPSGSATNSTARWPTAWRSRASRRGRRARRRGRGSPQRGRRPPR